MVIVEHLTKYYGDHPAVHDLSFEFAGPGVYGLLGPNGAGKSTTMNIMTGCLSATEGHVLIDGHDIYEEPRAAKKLIGYLPEQPPLYLNETPREYLKFAGEARGIKGRELKERINEVIRLTGIEKVADRLMTSLSKGYKQRVGIAQALIGSPSVIILDEPTVGLDPLQIIEIRELIKNLGKDRTVILSSHILSEVQMVCGQVLIIAGGRLVAFDTPEGLENHMMSSGAVIFTAETSEAGAARILGEICGSYECSYESVTGNPGGTGNASLSDTIKAPAAQGDPADQADDNKGMENVDAADDMYMSDAAKIPAEAAMAVRVTVKTGQDDTRAVSRSIFFKFAAAGIAIVEMTSRKASLEDVFIELTEGGAEGAATVTVGNNGAGEYSAGAGRDAASAAGNNTAGDDSTGTGRASAATAGNNGAGNNSAGAGRAAAAAAGNNGAEDNSAGTGRAAAATIGNNGAEDTSSGIGRAAAAAAGNNSARDDSTGNGTAYNTGHAVSDKTGNDTAYAADSSPAGPGAPAGTTEDRKGVKA